MSKATPLLSLQCLGGRFHFSYDNPMLGIGLARLCIKIGEVSGQNTLSAFWLTSLVPSSAVLMTCLPEVSLLLMSPKGVKCIRLSEV